MGIKIFGQNILKGVKHDNNLAVLAPAPLSNLRVRHIAFNKGRVGFPMLGQNVKLWFLSSGSAFLDDSQVGGICFWAKMAGLPHYKCMRVH